MNHTEIHAIVIGSIHHNTLGVVRSLGEASIPIENLQVVIVGSEVNVKNIISTSKYVLTENMYYVDGYGDIVPFLMDNPRFKADSVLICCSDGASEAVMNAKEVLCAKYRTPQLLSDASKMMVKSEQNSVAAECGLNVPISGDFSVQEEIDWDVFPCIIKPYKSVAGAGKADIHIIHSKEELATVWQSLQADAIQIQQYIEKEMEFQLIGCSLDGGKNILIPGFTKILRQPKNTNTGYLLYSPITDLEYDRESVEKFIQKIGYSGLFSVEFIRGKDGKDYFLEINMRNDGNAYCVKSAGVNLPYIWTYYQTYGTMPNAPISFVTPIYFIPDFNDLKIALKHESVFKWLKEFKNAQSHSIYNKSDMRPFKFEFFRQVKRIIKRH